MCYANNEVVSMFLEKTNANDVKGSNVKVVGNRLFSYDTCMAEWHEGKLYVNNSKYSRTTAKQMNSLRIFASNNKDICIIVETNGEYDIKHLA